MAVVFSGNGQQALVPFFPLPAQAGKDFGLMLLQVGALPRVIHDVEQKLVVIDLEIFPRALACRALTLGFVAPEQGPFGAARPAFQYGQDILAVAGKVGVLRCTGSGQQRGQPVEGGRDLLLYLGLKASAPAQQRGHAYAAFEQLGFLAREGPGLGKALAAVVAGEDDDGVVCLAAVIECLQHLAHGLVQRLDDLAVFLQTAAVVVEQAFDIARDLFVVRPLPGPVRRGEVQ